MNSADSSLIYQADCACREVGSIREILSYYAPSACPLIEASA